MLNKTGSDAVTTEMLEQITEKGGRRYRSTIKQSPNLNNSLRGKQDYKNINAIM